MSDNKYEFDKDELENYPEFSPNENLKFVVGDLFQAKQELVKYELGEIASINNLLAGSYLKMKNFHEEQIESSIYEEEEFESEKRTKTSQSSQQMMSEVSRSKLNQSNSFSAGGDVSGSYGTVKFNAYADYNNNQSKQQSRETAKEFASQVVNESEESVRERRLRQAFSRNLEIIRKEEEYGFDNRGGGHVVGVKCFVNEVHKVTLLNHNKHLFSTIMLAHPSEAYKKYLHSNNLKTDSVSLENPVKPLMVKEKVLNNNNSEKEAKLLPKDINNDNWQSLAFHFGVSSEDLPIPLENKLTLTGSGKTDSGSETNLTKNIVTIQYSVPEGYLPKKIRYGLGAGVHNSSDTDQKKLWTTRLFLGNYTKDIKTGRKGEVTLTSSMIEGILAPASNNFEIGVEHHNVYDQTTICFLECELNTNSQAYKTWQLDFYNALKDAQQYNTEENPMAFMDNLGVGKVDFRNNPTLAKKFIRHELQRCVIQQVFGSNLEGFSVLNRKLFESPEYPNIDLEKLSKLSPLLTYLNSVFDFEKMTYRFLPNYLGAKWNREEIYADTPVGPLKDFMEASFAQMILPVARGMEHKFRYFMLTNGLVYEGEDIPVIDDEVSLSILAELDDNPSLLDEEAAIVDESLIRLPSPHIMLMEDADISRLDYTSTDPEKLPTPSKSIEPKKGEGDVE